MRSAMPFVAAALVIGPTHAAAPNMKEGLWEITTRMEMVGKPDMVMPQQTVRQCMTKKEIEDPGKTTPSAAGTDGRCKMTDYSMRGSTATWKVACEGEGAMTGTGSVTYSGDAYSGTQTMVMKAGNQVMNMKMIFSGRRTGDCPRK